MPGAYAHITVVNEYRNPAKLMAIPDFPEVAAKSFLRWFKYAELGAVSPDYPYLAVGNKDAAAWADLMHYTHTGAMVREGSKLLRAIDGEKKSKCLAWLMGYASHVTADMTIHPVVELKVGKYEENKSDHRTCEMHQDVFIFRRLNVGDAGVADYLSTGIGACSVEDNDDKLDADIIDFWRVLLKAVHPVEFAANPPDIHKWHERFNEIVELISDAGGHLLPFARHLAADSGVVYPAYDQIDKQYVENLNVPNGIMSYDDIFNNALNNVANVWGDIAHGTFTSNDMVLTRFGEWNLDTGRDQTDKLIFWG